MIQPDAYLVLKREEAIELTHREFELSSLFSKTYWTSHDT